MSKQESVTGGEATFGLMGGSPCGKRAVTVMYPAPIQEVAMSNKKFVRRRNYPKDREEEDEREVLYRFAIALDGKLEDKEAGKHSALHEAGWNTEVRNEQMLR